MNCCPTCPVAPSMPTSILIVVPSALSSGARRLQPGVWRPHVRTFAASLGSSLRAPLKKKRPTRWVTGSAVGRSRCVTGLALAHTHSDTAGPLSAEALSSVGGEVHEGGSIAWVADATSVVPCVGAAARRRHQGSRRPAVRVGTGLGAAERPSAGGGAGRCRRRLDL